MDTATLNRELANILGITQFSCTDKFNDWTEFEYHGKRYRGIFNPAENSNHLREYVLPEIERRFGSDGISAFYEAVRQIQDSIWESSTDDTYGAAWDFLTAPSAVLAAAALKVLQEARN